MSTSSCLRTQAIVDQLTMAAILHTSVLAPHFEPSITSGDRYCLVWISFVKWWFTQQALPRSAILTLMTSRPKSSAFRFSPVDDDEELEDLSREIPETSFVRRSLGPEKQVSMRSYSDWAREQLGSSVMLCADLRCLFPLLLLDLVGR